MYKRQRHELVVVRSSGLSVWQFLFPIVVTAFMIGFLLVTVVNPIGSVFVKKFQTLEADHLERQASLISFSKQGLWLRQEHNQGKAILHSASIKMPEWILEDVIVFFFNADNDFVKRLDSQSAVLNSGEWQFEKVLENQPGERPVESDFISLATNLTIDDIEDSFADPETVSFWKLPAFIRIVEETGFDAAPLRVHHQSLMAKPILFVSMILLAASVSLRPARLRGPTSLVVSGVAMGVIVFFLSSFLQALGSSNQIPVVIASWFPAIITFLLGLGAMMVLEDG